MSVSGVIDSGGASDQVGAPMVASVILPVFNGAESIARAIDSALAQTFKPDFEVMSSTTGRRIAPRTYLLVTEAESVLSSRTTVVPRPPATPGLPFRKENFWPSLTPTTSGRRRDWR